MAVLENIRVKLGVFITILIALSLLSFIVDPSTLSTTFQRMSSNNKVGSMNGKSISYQEYYTAVEQNKNLFETLYGQSLSSEEQLSDVRDYTWQNYFDRYVFEPKAAAAGLNVGDQEMYDLTQGANISPVLSSQSSFLDENGNFSREALSQFIQNIDYDATGTYAAYWDYLRDQIYKQQLYSKYNALLYNSSVFSPLQASRAIEDNNLTSDVDFIMATVGFAADSALNITTGDQFISKKEQKEKIISDFGGMCCEMEGAAIAQACYLNSTPFVVIRAISDKYDGSNSVDFEIFKESAAKNCAGIVQYMVEHINS